MNHRLASSSTLSWAMRKGPRQKAGAGGGAVMAEERKAFVRRQIDVVLPRLWDLRIGV